MRSFGHILFWGYRMLSILVIIFGVVQLILFKNASNFNRNFLIPIIIIDLLLLCATTLVSVIRKESWQSIPQLLRSTRLRLTLWYTLILALVLLIFSSIVYETTRNDLNSAVYASLRSRLIQVASTYNPQTGKISIDLNNIEQVNSNTGTSTVPNATNLERKFGTGDIVLLLTPSGKTLQMTSIYADSLSWLAPATENMWNGQKDQPPYLLDNSPLGQVGTTNLQVYEFGDLQFYNLAGKSFEFDQAAIVNQQQQVVALLVVGIPSDVPYWLSDLLSVFAMAVPLVLLLSIAAGYWLAGRAMRPVQAITRTAQQISETDLHRRLKLKQRDEMGELAATFDRMLDRLEAAFARQRQFTADASHELRTPLSIVDLEATRALAHDLTPQENQQAFTTIQQENRHMTQLVNDLLMLARADAGQNKIKHEEVDVSEVVVDTVERLAPLAEHAGIVMKVAPLPELIILGDRIYLVQLLTNIIENALKYSSATGTNVDINLVQQRKQGQAWAILSVCDDGPGIASEHLPHLFERFYRVDQTRTHSQEMSPDNGRPTGNGLGLSIAQWIAQEHGGEITVRSAPGCGSVFEIWLPLQSAGATTRASRAPHSNTGSKQKESNSMSQHRDFGERNGETPPSYSSGYEETPDYNSYATGFGLYRAGQKLSGPTYFDKTPTASQRLALAITSLALWVFTLFGLVVIAATTQADSSAGTYTLLGMTLFAALIAIVNVVFNRKT
ncbi:MAG TPA: HAMP domain-containing sensor histidine kinase [Ktedonobacteraceae bacterium]|nr:HAMP domain-containing sensor histidine kinase [Ktedonobacteraceae bacterium]